MYLTSDLDRHSLCPLWQAPASLSSNPSPSTQASGSRCWSTALCSSSMCWKKTAASTCVESATTLELMSASPCISMSKVSLMGKHHPHLIMWTENVSALHYIVLLPPGSRLATKREAPHISLIKKQFNQAPQPPWVNQEWGWCSRPCWERACL